MAYARLINRWNNGCKAGRDIMAPWNLRPIIVAIAIGVLLGLVSTGLAASDPGGEKPTAGDATGDRVSGSEYNRVIILDPTKVGTPATGNRGMGAAEIAAFETEPVEKPLPDINWELLPLD
jgi:hypothetical protein